MKRIESEFVSSPIRPNNGTEAFKLLGQNNCIEVKNEVIYQFLEELDNNTDFSYCYHLSKHNNNWTTLNKLE